MKERTARGSRFFVFCLAVSGLALTPVLGMPSIMIEPYKVDAGGVSSPLSADPGSPTVFLYGAGETIQWWAISSSAGGGIPASQWHVRNSSQVITDYPADWCSNGAIRFCGSPEGKLLSGVYEFWVTATDDEGTDTSGTYFIRMTFPPYVETKYHPTATEFLGKLARVERTAFNFGGIANGIVDSPEVTGCDNPAMFYGNGKLHFIFGDPNIYTGDPGSPTGSLHGAIAFTDQIVPEKGIDISHHRNWVMNPQTHTAKSLIDRLPGTARANNTGGAILPHGEGHRIWFAVYDYGSGPRPSYQNYYQVSIVYSDDYFATPAVRNENLILWDKDDVGNGPNNPDPYLGYHMRVFKDHLYMMIPREGGSNPVLLRCHLNDLDALSLDTWHFLVSVDADGRATWSKNGVTRGQISRAQFPTVEFDNAPANIVNTVVWNPYLNRWIAVSALGGRIWESRQLWGPYTELRVPQFFNVELFDQYYDFFSHELMLGNNGEWFYHAQARSWQPLSYYGTYHQRLHLRDKLKMTVSPKSGVAGDTLTITCTNDTGLPAPPPANLTVTVDGNPATFVSQAGDTFQFTYQLTGTENGGVIGVVDVAGVMDVPVDAEWSFRCKRDVALIVNHRNELGCSITSPLPGSMVSGWLPLQVSAAYATAPEILAPQKPEVRILKTELREVGGEEAVLDTDVEPPYTLHVDTTRFEDGPREFKVIAYDTLDRRGVATITVNVNNGIPPAVLGNRITDGDMEALDTSAWQSLYGAVLSKTGGEEHRSGRRSLLVHSDSPASSAGFRKTVTGLQGGERLRLTGWARLKNNYTATFRWVVSNQSGGTITSQYVSSYGFFRRLNFEFQNPIGNTKLTIDGYIRDTGTEGVIAGEGVTSVEAVVDDIVLRPACHPIVQAPANVQWLVEPSGTSVLVTWEKSPDVNVAFYGIYRRGISQGPEAWEKIGEVRVWESSYTDAAPPGSPHDFEYRVVSIDDMGWESDDMEPLGEVSDVLDGEPPLLITGTTTNTVIVESDPLATAYNVYADSLGSWYSPTVEEGSVCGITEWSDNGDGTVTLPYQVPPNSWILVTASDQCQEGSAGEASNHSPRTASGTWPTCGATP